MSDQETTRLINAFVQGARWWEFHETGATMWNSDRVLAEEAAWKMAADGTLGLSDYERIEACARNSKPSPQS